MIILQIHFYALKARGNERVKLSINASTINGKDHYIAINVSKVQTVNTSIDRIATMDVTVVLNSALTINTQD